MTPEERHLWRTAQRVCTPAQLEAARLVWVREISSRDAARLLGISHGALQDRLRNARTRIHRHLHGKKAA